MKLCKEYTKEPYSILMNQRIHFSLGKPCYYKIIHTYIYIYIYIYICKIKIIPYKIKVNEKNKTIDNKIEQNKPQSDLDKKIVNISAFSSGNVSEYEFLTGQDVLPGTDLLQKADAVKIFEYLVKKLKTQTDIAKKQYQKLDNTLEFYKIIKKRKSNL